MKPFWEDEYLNKEKSTFGNPSKEVKELVPYLKKDAKIHKINFTFTSLIRLSGRLNRSDLY